MNGEVLFRGLGGREDDKGDTKTSKEMLGVLTEVKDTFDMDFDFGDGVWNIPVIPSKLTSEASASSFFVGGRL